jgi:hypothetical protein
VPAGASSIVRAPAPVARARAGQAAGEEGFTYRYQGRQIVQADLIAERERHIVWVELDADAAQAAHSETALRELLASWRWH